VVHDAGAGQSSARGGLTAHHGMFRQAPKEVNEEVVGKWCGRARNQSGQGMVEYALILVLVSIVVIVILLTMGNQIQNVFSNVVAALG